MSAGPGRSAKTAGSGALSLVAALAIAAGGCGSPEEIKPVRAMRSSTAETLGMFSTALPEDLREQALLALQQDAYRREHRFLEAASPGHLFAATDVTQGEIEGHAWTNEELFQLGAQLFHVTFTVDVGFGGADLPPLARFQTGRRGGPDSRRCASCHWRGGPAGGGDGADNAYLDGDGEAQSSALARNPIALPGAGLVEILAAEMSADLAAARASLIKAAKQSGAQAQGELITKGISFGTLVARPDGSVDLTDVVGVDPDLVVKPFGWKGNMTTLREAVEDALNVHHGMQSSALARSGATARIGPFPAPDPDGDGVIDEIEEGQVTALTLYVAMQEVPQIVLPEGSDLALGWAEGRVRFEEIGCASCHVPSLPLRSTTFSLPSRGGGPAVNVDLAREGAEPRIAPSAGSGEIEVFLFSDLKRHVMGAKLEEPRFDRTVPGRQFLTRPLWGVARSRPYLHDAHAPTLEDAILEHGGEAQEARDAYAALDDTRRGTIRIFLTSMTRARRMISP